VAKIYLVYRMKRSNGEKDSLSKKTVHMFVWCCLWVCSHRAGWNVRLTAVGLEPATFGLLKLAHCGQTFSACPVCTHSETTSQTYTFTWVHNTRNRKTVHCGWANQIWVFHILSMRNYRNFCINGKQSIILCSLSFPRGGEGEGGVHSHFSILILSSKCFGTSPHS
jgi:hypothetical protein